MRLLVSYWFFRKVDMAAAVATFPERPELFADSGGYSAATTGATIDVADYAAWLHRWGHLFSAYANLDVIGNAQGTARNQSVLEHAGLRPLPVFHCGEPMGVLEDLCSRYRYVCLGGMVPWTAEPAKVMRWSVACFRIAKQTGTVFHGFGQTSPKALHALPYYSVDSSTWSVGRRFGHLTIWDPKTCRLVQVPTGDHKAIYARAELIRAQGGDPAMLIDPGFARRERFKDETRSFVLPINLAGWARFQQWLTYTHGPVPAPHGYQGEGTKAYAAVNNITDVKDFAYVASMGLAR